MPQCRIPRPKDPDAALRAEVVEVLFAYVERLRVHFEGIAKSHDLTPVQAKLLLGLGDKAPMRTLASEMCCDPSNITGVVDRLEERGLISRTEDPEDRRVKILQTTAAGRKLRDSFVAKLFADVPGMSNLTRAQVAGLKAALAPLVEE
ncbi:MAG TPA: MarR family transcriptional regulator [Phycisphaerales bacterium]|nr:MarR family transcriptional regulator [Phycisphaerales bacterium]